MVKIIRNVPVLIAFWIASLVLPAYAQEALTDQSFTVRNASDQAIWAIQASPDSEAEWGADRLEEDQTLPPGAEFLVKMDGYGEHCVFDIRIIDERLDSHTYNSVNLCEVNDIAFPREADSSQASRSFAVRNASDVNIWTIRISRDSDDQWSEDRLGSDVLEPGAEFLVKMDGYGEHCVFNIRIEAGEMFDIQEHSYEQDLCDNSRLVFGESRDTPIREGKIVGTAFAISRDTLITNHHVVQGCRQDSIVIGQYGSARLVAHSDDLDLAALEVQGLGENARFAHFRRAKVRLGEQVVVFGYPATDIMSRKGTVATGVIGSLSGGKDDINEYQIMVPIHPGNSGSPLLDSSGFVTGIIRARLQPIHGYQLVSYAVKSNAILSFLEANRLQINMGRAESRMEIPDIVEEASQYTFPVLCEAVKTQ